MKGPAGVVVAGRPRAKLVEQMGLIEAYLGALLTDEDREATASAGWRPHDWDPKRRRPSEASPAGAQAGQDWRPHPRETPPWQAESDRILDELVENYPLYVRAGLPGLLRALPLPQQLIVDLHCRAKFPHERIADTLAWWGVEGYGRSRVWHQHERALESLARGLWDDDGQPRYG